MKTPEEVSKIAGEIFAKEAREFTEKYCKYETIGNADEVLTFLLNKAFNSGVNCVKTPLVMIGTFGGAMILLQSADQRLAEDAVALLRRMPEFSNHVSHEKEN